MKKKLLLMLMIVLSVSVTACTYWTPTEKNGAFFDTEMNEKVNYEQRLSGYDRVEIIVDLTVSSVKVDVIEGDTLKYEQKANKEALLAGMNKREKGNTLILTFKNDTNPNLLTGTQNSETRIWVPSGVEVIWQSNVNVGDLDFNMNRLDVVEVDAVSNVGKMKLSAKDDFDRLTYVKLKTNVGEIAMDIKGELDVLEKVDLSTNTGSVIMSLDGVLKQSLVLDAKADVGSVDLNFKGNYERSVKCTANASVGDVKVLFPKNHEVALDAKTSEFTSKLIMDDVPFSKSQSIYRLDGDGAMFTLEVSVSIGDATIGYSK
ncbi:MAG TPA: hypothetical protein DCS67_02905 [Clostridiales bacterium UBA8960]|jgi:hypothetical protein|nr:hypothetical protein [Clostridiales bacterium UBA8960]